MLGGLSKASTRACVVTSVGREGLYMEMPGRGWGIGDRQPSETMWPSEPSQSLRKTFMAARVHAG